MTEYLTETVFTWGSPPIKFGIGAVDEIGYDCGQFGLEQVLVLTDPWVAESGLPDRVSESLAAFGVKATVFDGVHCEPTDESFREAIEFAKDTDWDGFVAVGGGSTIDTAKAVNLMTTYPGDVLDYVNPPLGAGKAPPGPVKPLIAVPTTAGTGSESTAVCVVDILSLKVKTGISHPRLRPSLGVVDPLLTLSVPPHVSAACGMDVLCHAVESYTARPYHAFARRRPEQRTDFAGANPISDAFTEKALQLLARSFRTAVLSGGNLEARGDMMLAATFAGMGFGNAGCHVPHACAYPIAGRVKNFRPPDYPDTEPMVPHGEAVSLTAPAAFRFTFPTDAERHVRVAEWLDPTTRDIDDPRERLPQAIISIMRDIGIANGIEAVGYAAVDIPDLVDGAVKQRRLLTMTPRSVSAEDLEAIFTQSLRVW
jgi:hydroxyacid-oxoacid transhydrogenase